MRRLETVLLVKAACGTVPLMCVKFQSIRGKTLGEDDQPRSPTFAPLAGIDKHPVDIRTLHRQISDNLLFKRTHPDIALSLDDFPKDRASAVEGEGPPQRKKRVCGLPRPVPNSDDGRFVVVLKWSIRYIPVQGGGSTLRTSRGLKTCSRPRRRQ